MSHAEAIKAANAIVVLTGIVIDHWGTRVEVEGFDDPIDLNKYRLCFKGCREVHYLVHEPTDGLDTTENLAGIEIGLESHGAPAIFTGVTMELWVSYDTVEVSRISPME